MLKFSQAAIFRYASAFLAVVLALLLTNKVDFLVERSPFFLFFAAVVLISWFGGRGPGVVAGILSVAVVDFFIIPPIYSFVPNGADAFRIGTFVLLAFPISWMISALQMRESRMRDSEAKYRTLFQYSPDGIVIADTESYYLDANPTICEMLGYTRDELVGLHASDIVVSEEIPRIGEALETIKSTSDYHREWVFRRKTGSVLTGEVAATVMPDGNILAVIRDVSERENAQAMMRESESRLAGIIDSAMDAIITLDSDQKIVLFNAAAESMFKCPAHEAIGQPIEKFIPERFRAVHSRHVRQFDETRTTKRSMMSLRGISAIRSDGDEFPIEASISQLETGNQKYFRVILRDITLRQRAEADANRLAALVESSDDAIVGKDLNGLVNSWNRGAEKMFGYSTGEMLGQPITRIMPPGKKDEEEQILEQIRQGNTLSHFEARRLRRDGTEFDVSVTVSAIRDRNGTIIGASKVARDITEQKIAETAIRDLNQTLEQRVCERTAQLEAANNELESFSYSVSHDLRAPLRHIDGFVQLLTKREAERLDATSARYLNVVSEAVSKMGTLIDELLAFSRTSRVEMKTVTVDLNAIIAQTKNELAPAMAGRNINWNIADLPPVKGDSVLLGIVMTNLLSNATKYTRGRTEPHIEIGMSDETEREVTIFVKDNGAGFDMKYADKLFGVFQRLHTDDEFEGIGIGLATVQRIIHRHGGQIWAESDPDMGATFYLTMRKTEGEPDEH